MYYIVFNKNTNKVERILCEKPVSVTSGFEVAKCERIPQGRKFTAINIQEKQEEYIDRVTETVTLATGVEKEIVKAVTKTKIYLVCNLKGE